MVNENDKLNNEKVEYRVFIEERLSQKDMLIMKYVMGYVMDNDNEEDDRRLLNE